MALLIFVSGLAVGAAVGLAVITAGALKPARQRA
jgi:hypothetical protein